MKIAINNLPLNSGHKIRGIGYYTRHLIDSLRAQNLVEIQEFSKLSEIIDADLVHYPLFDLFSHSLPIKKIFPTLVTIHDVIPLLFPNNYPIGIKGRINYLLQRAALNSCKAIITDSQVSKNDIIKYIKIKDNKINVIPLAADKNFKVIKNDAKLIFIRRKFNLPDQFLLYVGDANWFKNLPFLIEGFCNLKQLPGLQNLKLVLVGNVFLKNLEGIDHPELKSLKQTNQLIKQSGLESSVIRPGRIDITDLTALYNLATIYIQPSLYEGFGLPVLEALSCGAPVVSSDRGSLKEIGGQSVLYFDPTNLKQFIAIVQTLIKDRSLQEKLSKSGLKQAAKFSWDKVAQETIQVYKNVIRNE